MDDQTPHPDAGDTPTKRDVTIRKDSTERVWVEWYVGTGGSFTRIYSERDGEELRVLALDSNELGQMLAALDPEEGACMVRDMGVFERVSVERSDGVVTLAVEELGEIARMLILEKGEAESLTGALERAEDELPRTEDESHV